MAADTHDNRFVSPLPVCSAAGQPFSTANMFVQTQSLKRGVWRSRLEEEAKRYLITWTAEDAMSHLSQSNAACASRD